MEKKITFVFIAILMSAFISKASVPVSGKIIEKSTGNPLEFANILLLSLPDSTFVTGATSDKNGDFRFDNVNNGNYLLKVLYIGLETQFIPCQAAAELVTLRDIQMAESNVLKEVVVTSKIPPFQAGINGGIVANVSTTLLSTVGTATDVLQRMPGIMTKDDKITVFGKGTPIVYINNRKLNDLSELERLESSEISTVELITNPGAKYDAEGRAVLIIKTKSKINGFSAQATERLRQGIYFGDNDNISISYTHDKLNLFATYYHYYGKQRVTENHYITLNNPDSVWQYNDFQPNYWYSNNTQQVSGGFDYSLNDKNAIGGQYQYYTNNYKDILPIKSTTYLNGLPYENSQSQGNRNDDSYQHLVNAFYNGDFSDKYSLHFDFDYLKNHDHQVQNTNETVDGTDNNEISILNQTDYNMYAGKLTNSYKSEIGLFEFGGEYNHIAGSGYVHSNGYTNDTEFTNTEQKAAGFVNYSHKIEKINVAAGLRYEFTSELYTQGEEKTKFIDRTYSDLYPNISLSTNLNNVDLGLAFNKRTERPSFTELNGNVVYINRFVFQKGNPYLNKTNIYDVNFQATKKPFYLNVGYTYEKNLVFFYFEDQENNANAILATFANFPKYQTVNATLNWNTKISFWQPNYTIGVEKPFFSAIYNGQEVAYNEADWFFTAYNDFTFPHDWVLSGNFQYQSDAQEAFVKMKGWQRLDMGIRKSFLNNNLRLNLMVYDLFNWVDENRNMPLNNLDWISYRKRETRYVTLSITYLLNNYKKKYRGGSAAQDDINRF